MSIILPVSMDRFLLICFAGALGTGTRYLTTLWAAQRFGAAFPYGTLIVNVAGSFLIAFLLQLALAHGWSPAARGAVAIGFLGGLTTYSSFNYETMSLAQQGAIGAAAINLGVTVVGGFASGALGLLAGQRVAG
jgi:CrcB protein